MDGSNKSNWQSISIKKIEKDIGVESKIYAIKPELNERNTIESLHNVCLEKNKNIDKKSIEPVKSSGEILTELFKVFNATPPDELLNDGSLRKKQNKQKKHKKEKKKKKRNRSPFEVLSSNESEDSDNDDNYKKDNQTLKRHKHKKKKKHKHKNEKDKCKHKRSCAELCKTNNSTDINTRQDRTTPDPIKSVKVKRMGDIVLNRKMANHRCTENTSVEKCEIKEKIIKTDSNLKSVFVTCDNLLKIDEQKKQRLGQIKTEPKKTKIKYRNDEEEYFSEVSFSDEDSFQRERRSDNKTSDRQQFGRCASTYHVYNSFYAGTVRNRIYNDRHYRNISRSKCRQSRSRSRENSRSRSRSRSRNLGIDKKRLLEIARKNAINMFKHGNLPGCDNMSEEFKDKVLLKMRYGGRTVQDLTDFCKKISNGENLSDLSSEEDFDVDKNGKAKAFHHPFLLKDREPIVMHIRNNTKLPIKTDEQKKNITMQFPVSSGQQHRIKECWIPVESKAVLEPIIQSSNTFTGSITSKTSHVKEKQQEPAFKVIAVKKQEETQTTDISLITPRELSTTIPPQGLSTPIVPAHRMDDTPSTFSGNTTKYSNAVNSDLLVSVPMPLSATSDMVFQPTPAPPDVSSIISKRLTAMRRLQENPMDSEAIKMMYNSQKEMSSWASSKHLPGQFTGSTGANIMSSQELSAGPQVWARRDQLTSSKPVTGGMGMQLLQKMGWKPGEGLGREKKGSLQPLLLDVKLDKRGLVSKADKCRRSQLHKKQKQDNTDQTHNMNDKHPVCLLNELTSKRKWTPPLYTLVNEMGPSHSKMFMFSVSINAQTFTPNQASNTKKEAKLLAARYCLQQMGILP